METILKAGSLACIAFSLSKSFTYQNQDHNFNVQNDQLDKVSILQESLTFFKFGTHSYITFKTCAGQTIRLDYSANKGVEVLYNYYSLLPRGLERKGKAIPATSVKRAIKVFKKHALKSDYSVLTHNCHTVSSDFFNEITGVDIVDLGFELMTIFEETRRRTGKKDTERSRMFLSALRPMFFDLIKKGLKLGMTRDQIEKCFKEARDARSLNSFMLACKAIVSKEEFESVQDLLLIQCESADFLYNNYTAKMQIINKNWINIV